MESPALAPTVDQRLAATSLGGAMPTVDDDAATVLAAKAGDRAAFARLHARFGRMVHGIVLARAPLSEARDLVQSVFLDALNKLHTLRDPNAFGPWIATMARHATTQFHRQRNQHRVLESQTPPATPPTDSQPNVGDALEILHAIRGLPEAYSETLALRLVEGLTGPQIAACTGLTPGSVRVNLHRGMQLLRERLGLEESP